LAKRGGRGIDQIFKYLDDKILGVKEKLWRGQIKNLPLEGAYTLIKKGVRRAIFRKLRIEVKGGVPPHWGNVGNSTARQLLVFEESKGELMVFVNRRRGISG